MPDPDTIKLALIQHTCGSDPQANLAASLAGIRAAAEHGTHLVLLPELHNHGYFCRSEDPACFDLAEPIPGPTSQALAEVAAETGTVVVGSIFERRTAGLFHNTAVVLDGKHGLVGRYRKMHIPDDPGYYEKFYFTPGDQGFVPVDTSLGRLGILVCWDQWYPEAARLMALAGARLLLYPSAIGWDAADDADEQARQRSAWRDVQRGHAIANHLPVAACNRVGTEAGEDDRIEFWGNSFICGPQGELLAEAGAEVEILLADLPLARTENLRRMWPFLRDRRIDAYADLLQRYRD